MVFNDPQHQDETGGKGEFDPGELDRLLLEGNNSGDPLDGEQVPRELRQLRNERRDGTE